MALTEEQLRNLPLKAQVFWRKAFEFMKKNQAGWIDVRAGSKEFDAWRAYFRRQGWTPFAIRQIELGKLQLILMPTKWPQWFDADYTPLFEAAE